MDGANDHTCMPWLNSDESESLPTPALAVSEMDGKKLARAAPISALALFRLCSASWISGRRSSTDEETPAGTRVILLINAFRIAQVAS